MRELNFFDYLILFFGSINLIRIALFLIGSDIYSLKSHLARKKQHKTTYTPTVSVVIPAHNEEKTIVRAIESVIKNTYPAKKLEVIVVDDGSTDMTYQKAQEYKIVNKLKHVWVIKQTKGGKAQALNTGIKHYSTGSLIMCLDADSMIAPEAIANSVKRFRDKRVKGVSANVKIINDGSLLNFIQQFEYIICYQMKRAQTVFNIEYIIGGIGSMFRRSALKEVNYYDTDTVTEDIDITMKIIQKGNISSRMIFADDVIAYTESCMTIGALIRQRFRWKWGRYQTFLKNMSLFFNSDKKYAKLLTFVYLPFAIYGDFAFFFEPWLLTYILFITIYFRDVYTILTAVIVVSSYIAINVLAEDTMTIKERVKLVVFAPSMYVFFYVLSFVEYIALIRSCAKMHTIVESVDESICHWQHVERAGQLSF